MTHTHTETQNDETSEDFNARWTKEANRVRALDFATRTVLAEYYNSLRVIATPERVLAVAEKFNDWLNMPIDQKDDVQ